MGIENTATVASDQSGGDEQNNRAAAVRPPPQVKTNPASIGASSLRRRQMLADAAAILAGVVIAYAWQETVRPVPGYIQQQHLVLLLASSPIWVGAMMFNKLYFARAIERPGEEFQRILVSTAMGVGSIVAIGFAFRYNQLSRLWIASLGVSVTFALSVERRIARGVFERLRTEGRIRRRVAIVGTDAHALGLMHLMQRNPSLGYEVVGFIGDDDLGERGGVTVLGPTDIAEQLLFEHRCGGALLSLGSVEPQIVNRLTRTLTDSGFHVALSSTLRDIDVTRMRPQSIDGHTMLYVEPRKRDGWRAMAKRVFDVVVAVVGLVWSAPVLVAAAIAIKIDSPGPVFFRQERVGLGGEPFRMIKLRSMTVDAEARQSDLAERNETDGALFKIHDDPRITRVGRILRKLSIDELPQFWNVIVGEMSVVGPRPALPAEAERWDPEVFDRLHVLPGITGLWQVSGRSGVTFDEYKRLDLYYVDNWSLLHDVKIVVRTFSAVVFQRGAS